MMRLGNGPLRHPLGEGGSPTASHARKVTAETLNFSQGVAIRETGLRFVIPIPIVTEGVAVHKVTKRDGTVTTKKGVAFTNPTDPGSTPVVAGDGQGVILVNVPNEDGKGRERATKLHEILQRHGGFSALTTAKKILALEAELHNAGFNDRYHSEDKQIADFQGIAGLSAIADASRREGLYSKAGKKEGRAVFVTGPVAVAIDRRFGDAEYPRGCFVIQIADSQDPSKLLVRSIAPEAMNDCWVRKDSGMPVLPTDCPQI